MRIHAELTKLAESSLEVLAELGRKLGRDLIENQTSIDVNGLNCLDGLDLGRCEDLRIDV